MGFRPESIHHFYRHLRLVHDNEYARGITIYSTSSYMTGLEAHFTKTSHLSGHRRGCARHLPLHPRERISHALLRIIDFPSLAFEEFALDVSSDYHYARQLLMYPLRSKQLSEGDTRLEDGLYLNGSWMGTTNGSS